MLFSSSVFLMDVSLIFWCQSACSQLLSVSLTGRLVIKTITALQRLESARIEQMDASVVLSCCPHLTSGGKTATLSRTNSRIGGIKMWHVTALLVIVATKNAYLCIFCKSCIPHALRFYRHNLLSTFLKDASIKVCVLYFIYLKHLNCLCHYVVSVCVLMNCRRVHFV